MDEQESVVEVIPKYGRGENPRSLANLTPWKPGQVTNHNGERGPYLKPRLQKYADMPIEEVKALAKSGTLPLADMVAITWWLDGLETGSFSSGARSREQLADRLDGPVEKNRVVINQNTLAVSWGDQPVQEPDEENES